MKIFRMLALAVGTGFGLCVLLGGPSRIRINVPAGNMKQTVTQFRDHFESHYLVPRQPIPLFSLMFRAGIHPLNIADEARIAKMANGKARIGTFSVDGSTITADGVEAKGVAFQVLFQDKISEVAVDCPAKLTAQISIDNSPGSNKRLQFDFVQPIRIRINPSALGLPVPNDLYLMSLSLSNAALDYQFSTSTTIDSGTIYEIYLDLNKSPTAER